MLPDVIHNSFLVWLQANVEAGCSIINVNSSGGGSINEAFKISTTCGIYFLKYNIADKYPLMFETEKQGLELLAKTSSVHVPEVFHTGISQPYSYITMAFEEQSHPLKAYWDEFASQLADLHRIKAEMYGLDHNNYIGSLSQSNLFTNDYYEFLVLQRLQPLIRDARDTYLLTSSDIGHFERLFTKLPELLPAEEPTLIHGDLWSGNLITTHSGHPCVIDPAVYYGHRESDIAMTKLFGGFPDKFYEAYDHSYPMIKGWQQRIELHQLYPLLVHVNLFGQSYVRQLLGIIRKF